MNTVYFQPKGIKPQYCEVGIISETDPEYIWYLDEPCKILISEVKIIEKENVIFDKKSRLIRVRQNELSQNTQSLQTCVTTCLFFL
jgi:hypothetical protein